MIPENVGDAARDGDLETVRAYFEDDSDGARDVDDICGGISELTPLMRCARGFNDQLTPGNVEVARYLLSRGASINIKSTHGQTALLSACYNSRGGPIAEMILLLLSAGADPNARNKFNRTALSAHVTYAQIPSVECVTALLRAGASLDLVYQEHTFEDQMSDRFSMRERPDPESFWPAARALAAGVRRNGSFKRYVREPHREVIALRGLAMRGHLVPRRRTRGSQKWTAAAAFLARLGDNGVVWNVLSFWRATN
jgi:hypothetical protein